MDPAIQTEHPKDPARMQYLRHEESSSDFTDQVMKRMSFPESLRKSVVSIVGGHMAPQFDDAKGSKAYGKYGKFLRNYGDLSKYILLLSQADRMSKGKQTEEELADIRTRQTGLRSRIDDYQQHSTMDYGVLYNQPLIRGDELMAMLPEVHPQLGTFLQGVGFKHFITNSFTSGQPMHWIKYITEQLIKQQQTHRVTNVTDARVFVLGAMKQIFLPVTKQIPQNDVQSSWNQIFKLAQVRGEFWITDSGTALGADGDVGDYNHEGHAIEVAQSQIMEGSEDWEGWKRETALEILAEQKQELEERKYEIEEQELDTTDIDKLIYENWERSKDPEYHAYELINANREKLGISEEDFDIAEGQGDARAYAMRNWGWKRLEGNHIETWTLTPNDLKIISDGLWDAYQEEGEKQKFTIYVYGTKKWYTDIPVGVIDAKSVKDIVSLDSQMSGYAKSDKGWKVAFPLMEPGGHSYENYQDLAHEGYGYSDKFKGPYPGKVSKIVLWFIRGMPHERSSEWDLNTWDATSDMSHRDWKDTWKNFHEILAVGRYDVTKDTASMRIHLSTPGMFLNNEYITNEVVKMLDRQFNNPAIVEL